MAYNKLGRARRASELSKAVIIEDFRHTCSMLSPPATTRNLPSVSIAVTEPSLRSHSISISRQVFSSTHPVVAARGRVLLDDTMSRRASALVMVTSEAAGSQWDG